MAQHPLAYVLLVHHPPIQALRLSVAVPEHSPSAVSPLAAIVYRSLMYVAAEQRLQPSLFLHCTLAPYLFPFLILAIWAAIKYASITRQYPLPVMIGIPMN